MMVFDNEVVPSLDSLTAEMNLLNHTFARVGAVIALNVEDYYSQKKALVASAP